MRQRRSAARALCLQESFPKHRTMGGNFSVRSAALVIENNSLLVAKSDNFDCYYVVGGTVQENETSETALVRELYEETGYHWETERLVFIQERIYPVGNEMHHQIVFFYLMKKTDAVIANGVNTDQQNEHLYWLPLEDLENVNLVPPFLKTKLKSLPVKLEHIVSYE